MITILRDTDAAQSFIHKYSLKGIEHKYIGEKVILKDLSSFPIVHPAKISLRTEVISGLVRGVIEKELLVKESNSWWEMTSQGSY